MYQCDVLPKDEELARDMARGSSKLRWHIDFDSMGNICQLTLPIDTTSEGMNAIHVQRHFAAMSFFLKLDCYFSIHSITMWDFW